MNEKLHGSNGINFIAGS